MKWWYWLILEVLIIFGVIAWIYLFPSEIEGDFAKGLVGFGLIYAIEEYKNINRRKTMEHKDGMTCGECLRYAFCPVANHNPNHKACMKITIAGNYTIEQNVGENRIEGGVVGISGLVDNCREISNKIADFEWQLKEVVEDNDYYQSENKKLIQENAELKFNLDYAKAVMHELLDNSNEYARARAEDFIKE